MLTNEFRVVILNFPRASMESLMCLMLVTNAPNDAREPQRRRKGSAEKVAAPRLRPLQI